MRGWRYAGWAAAALLALPAAAWAQSDLPANQQIETAAATSKGISPLAVPLPVSDPALGGGVVLAGALFYSPVQGGRQWVTGLGGLYTSNKDWGILVLQQADLLGGRLRLSGGGGYGSFNLDFFGIGQAAASRGVSIKLNQSGSVLILNGLYRVHDKVYLGLRYRLLAEDTKLAEPLFPDAPILPNAQLRTRISGLGPSFEYDSRNIQFAPTKGVYVNGQWLVDDPSLGSDFSYNKLTLAGNAYFSLAQSTVLAVRASICDSSQGAPFYDLCSYGSNHDLRGYEGGQYRDHAMAVTQAELRQHLFWRLGAVAFAGVGAVGPNFSSFSEALPAAGLGMRIQPSRKLPVNVSIDYAWGSHSSGLYLYIGEAF